MAVVYDEVCGLKHESQAERKTRLDPTRRDVRFKPRDEVLLDTTFSPLPSRDKLSPRWMDAFRVLEQTAPNTYRFFLARLLGLGRSRRT